MTVSYRALHTLLPEMDNESPEFYTTLTAMLDLAKNPDSPGGAKLREKYPNAFEWDEELRAAADFFGVPELRLPRAGRVLRLLYRVHKGGPKISTTEDTDSVTIKLGEVA
jgi:hypothetical protein